MNHARARLLLGVAPGAGRDEIETAFRRRAWALHPDRGGDAAAFADLADARLVLLGRERLGRERRTEGPRPGPVVIVSDSEMARRRVEQTLRRWVGRRGPGSWRRVV